MPKNSFRKFRIFKINVYILITIPSITKNSIRNWPKKVPQPIGAEGGGENPTTELPKTLLLNYPKPYYWTTQNPTVVIE